MRRCPGVHDLLGQRVELGLRLGLLLPELGGGTVPALGQGGLEVRSGLSGIGALLLEDGLALLPAGRGVPLRRVTLVIGCAPGIGEGPRRLGVGIPAALLGVLVGLVADGDDGLVGELPRVLRLGAGPIAQLGGFRLGKGEDLADPRAELLEGGRLGGACLLGGGLSRGHLRSCAAGGLLYGGIGCGGRFLIARLALGHPLLQPGERPVDLDRVVASHHRAKVGDALGHSVSSVGSVDSGTASASMTPDIWVSSSAISSRRRRSAATSARASDSTCRA